ncbi:MAG: electron transfer flavoprotein subunit beta/FixA family protein [Magnetococcus sp. MYC-9]
MNILVAIKPVVDPDRPVCFAEGDVCGHGVGPWSSPGGTSLGVATLLNPFDEVALEAAIRFREAGVASQVTVVTVGPPVWEEHLRTALAMGADRALRVEADAGLEPLSVAKCLAAAARHEEADLLLTGRQGVDADHGQTGVMTAALLGWGQLTCATRIDLQTGEVWVVRETKEGAERWAVPLPAVITVDWCLNGIQEDGGPRYASLPNIMKARRKPLERFSPDHWGLPLTPRLHCLAVQPPAIRPPGRALQSVEALGEVLCRAVGRL